MKRVKHSLSHYKLATLPMGKIVPVACFEVLPGDTVQHATSALIRTLPLMAPVMHPVIVRFHHWYCPNRLLWDSWEDFITGGPTGTDSSSPPYITGHAVNGFAAKSLADYFGIPVGSDFPALEVSAFPFRAYARIFNEYYRDQDLVTALTENTGSGSDTTTPLVLQDLAWEKDYRTSARPWPQKGPEVTLPLGTEAPVEYEWPGTATGGVLMRAAVSGNPFTPGAPDTVEVGTGGTASRLTNSDQTIPLHLDPLDTLKVDLSSASAVDVNTVRRAFAIQRYQEARAQYGSRFTEYLRYLGIRSSDARLQRPEYLGGGKQTIAFSEVLQTGVTTDGDDTEGVGNLKGHGISALRSRSYRRFFEEHGIVLTLMSVRPRSMYTTALERMWSRRTKEEYWQKELEQIGQQEVYSREVYAESDGNGGNAVFGYNDRYSEYRSIPSQVAGDFRSSLSFWHLAREFASAPTLNQSFTDCDPRTNIYSVADQDALLCMISHSIQARRMVARHMGVGRII